MWNTGVSGIDVTGVQETARATARHAAEVYLAYLGDSLVSLVAHGSAVKGGFIPHGSDIDLVLFVKPDALTVGGQLPLGVTVPLHRDLAYIDPAPYRYIQTYAYPEHHKPGAGLIPGGYHVVYGDPDVPLATRAELLANAHAALRALDPVERTAWVSGNLLEHGEGRLDRMLRYLCTDVWPVLNHVATVHMGSPLDVWRRPKTDVIGLLDGVEPVASRIRAVHEIITTHYAAGEPVESALASLQAGLTFLEAASAWYHRRPDRGRGRGMK